MTARNAPPGVIWRPTRRRDLNGWLARAGFASIEAAASAHGIAAGTIRSRLCRGSTIRAAFAPVMDPQARALSGEMRAMSDLAERLRRARGVSVRRALAVAPGVFDALATITETLEVAVKQRTNATGSRTGQARR